MDLDVVEEEPHYPSILLPGVVHPRNPRCVVGRYPPSACQKGFDLLINRGDVLLLSWFWRAPTE